MHGPIHKKANVRHKHDVLKKRHSVLVIAGFAAPFFLTAIALVVTIMHPSVSQSAGRLTSQLEVGVADLSPRGEGGGAFIPASCVLGPGLSGGHESCAPTVWWTPASITIPYGGLATFGWSSSQAYSCDHVVTGIAAGVGNFVYGGPSGTYTNVGPYSVSGVQTHTITCWDEPRTVSATAVLNITVLPDVKLETTTTGAGFPWAKIISFTATPSTVPELGSATLSWNAIGTCTGSGSFPGWAGAKAQTGSPVVANPNIVSTQRTTTYLFTLTCTKGATTVSASKQIVFYNDYTPPISCFTAGTKVTLADGSTKDIEDVVVGDMVAGSNGKANAVVGVEVPPLGDRPLYAINGSKAFVTAEHPFMTTMGWKSIDPTLTMKENALLDVGALSIGDILVTDNGNVAISSITQHSGDKEEKVYNLLLDGNHTYYANGFLVHNKMAIPD